MKRKYDFRAREPSFNKGDAVFLHNPHQPESNCKKSQCDWDGPYLITWGGIFQPKQGDVLETPYARLYHPEPTSDTIVLPFSEEDAISILDEVDDDFGNIHTESSYSPIPRTLARPQMCLMYLPNTNSQGLYLPNTNSQGSTDEADQG
ncbi:hypothetical protein CHS0354_013200 [Potamilus streckersoni]|uniref:Uncharacterized protein n=1 Tax=Potamilus streckersoni TaxID=2493646 RepID=A0AAE0RU60_9BIVA|nr:hypothetical protein CHS0354_013200 [Potamilus streckersoni]